MFCECSVQMSICLARALGCVHNMISQSENGIKTVMDRPAVHMRNDTNFFIKVLNCRISKKALMNTV